MAFFVGPILFPFICYGLLCLVMFVRSGEDGLKDFSALLAGDWIYFLPGASKITAIPMMIEADLPPALVASSTVYLDTVVAFFVAFNFGYIQRFPITDRFVGVFLRESEGFLERHHWIRNFSFLAIAFYVTLPFEGSGGIGGTLLGMAIGLGRLKTWLAILTGSTIASFSLAYSAAAARAYLTQVKHGGYLVLAFFLTIAIFISYKNRRSRAAAQTQPAGLSKDSNSDGLSCKELPLLD
jgi:hypothetical protein